MKYKDWHPVDQMRWQQESVFYYGEILTGDFCHYCTEWDDLPIDETCEEFAACLCEYDSWDMIQARTHREALREEIDRRSANADVAANSKGPDADT